MSFFGEPVSPDDLPPVMPAEREGLRAVYEEAERLIAAAGPRCDASGRCCRFAEYDHTLFVTDLEAQVLAETPVPIDSTAPSPVRSPADGCPYQVGRRCEARSNRPLGCRVYFCDPQVAEVMPTWSENLLERLRQVHAAAGREWRYRPLHTYGPIFKPVRTAEAATTQRLKIVQVP